MVVTLYRRLDPDSTSYSVALAYGAVRARDEPCYLDHNFPMNRGLNFIGLAHSTDWIITDLAGICYDSPFGSRVRLTLAPHFPASLTYVKATVEIPSGVVRSDWRHDGPLDRS